MRKTTIFRSVALAALAGGATLAYLQAQAPSKLETFKLADNLYAIHNDFVPGNTTAFITNEGVILVDDKFPADADNIVAEVRKLTQQPIKYVINTHHHGDHSGGNAAIQKLGAQLVSSDQARKNMVAGKQPGLTNITIEEKGHLYLGGEQVDLYYFGRAHTNGDIVAYFPKYRVLASGDIFAFGDATPELVDFPGGGSAIEWTSTLDKALQLDFDRVVPGHGVVATKADMRAFRDTSVKLRERVHAMVVNNSTRAEVEKMLRSEFHYADVHAATTGDLMRELR
jgi:cyclase